MSSKDALLQEIENAPEPVLEEVLDFLRFLRRKAAAAGQSTRRGVSTLEKAAGLLKTSGPAPTDDQVKQWLEEERMRRHG